MQPVYPVLFLSLVVSFYYILYGVWRLNPEYWNNRKSHLSEINWREYSILQNIHKNYSEADVSSEVTLVTAYFNIGSFSKGGSSTYTPNLYQKWMQVFGRLDNPLIVFTDSAEVAELFHNIRAKFGKHRTQIHHINQNDLWSFSLSSQIKDIYSQPNYPKFKPNTVNENYSCIMHAKFELVNKAIRENMIKTRYMGWLDIGLFRAVTWETHIFHLGLPEHFDNAKVSYSKVKEFDDTLRPKDVVDRNLVWVGGAMFLGQADIVYIYAEDYLKSVRKLLSMKLMSTDQQVIYIMYLPKFELTPRVELQLYTSHSGDDWFYIGYIIKDLWDKKLRESQSLLSYYLQLL